MMDNIGIDPDTPIQREPYLIVFNINTSLKEKRKDVNLDDQADVVSTYFGDRVEVKVVDFKSLSLVDQIRLISRAAVFVAVCGGGTVTGTFLPEGASVILYHYNGKLDFAFWNNFPHIKAHWFHLENQSRLDSPLVKLIGAELDHLDFQMGCGTVANSSNETSSSYQSTPSTSLTTDYDI
jgi:hypothetical protein